MNSRSSRGGIKIANHHTFSLGNESPATVSTNEISLAVRGNETKLFPFPINKICTTVRSKQMFLAIWYAVTAPAVNMWHA